MIEPTLVQKLEKAVLEGSEVSAREIAKELVKSGADPVEVIRGPVSLIANLVGEKFNKGELSLPELILAGDALAAVTKILDEAMPKGLEKKGKIVIATVEGDVHDIGKNAVAMALRAAGYEVFDLGVNVPAETVVNKAEELKVDIIALSALMTTTMPYQKQVVDELKDRGLRGKYKVIVGGGPVTQEFSDKIGADGTAPDPMGAVKLVDRLMAEKQRR